MNPFDELGDMTDAEVALEAGIAAAEDAAQTDPYTDPVSPLRLRARSLRHVLVDESHSARAEVIEALGLERKVCEMEHDNYVASSIVDSGPTDWHITTALPVLDCCVDEPLYRLPRLVGENTDGET